MPRTFNGTSGIVTLALGAAGSVSGPSSFGAICKTAANGSASYVMGVGGTARWTFGKENTNALRLGNSSAAVTSPTATITVANGWMFIGCSKAAGTTTPRFHSYVYSTGTWIHENAGATLADQTPNTSMALGNRVGGSNWWNGDIAVAGMFAANLTDAQMETLPFSLVPWLSYSVKGLWVLDQATTTIKVADLTGLGAGEASVAGTSVSSGAVPVWNRGAPVGAF